jgi:DNA-binding GntR family transcriptional regulator
MSKEPPVSLKIDHPPATLRDIVQDKMREAIISGLFKPGERLVERPLCEQLGVSRTVIRETIRYLEAEGLVQILPNRGPIVARMDWDDARQIYEIREKLETSAAIRCAEISTPELIVELDRALVELDEAIASGSAGDLYRVSTEFYRVIFETAGQTIAWEIVQRLNGRIGRLRAMTLSTEDRKTSGPAHMRAIRNAIADGDVAATQAAVGAHLADAASVAKRLLEQDQE